ncbi:MAG: DUF2905 domain-containing protein [Betaproteobacteria bacterium]|nr:MAG: DUF2905 domain-containing protein [Betaproteobacteria bacterium]TMI12132.1 MAG: DUF2905 domain-containing protein [Betaproteobacteria bacterium]
MARWLVIFGVLCIVIGLAWPWIEKLGLGRLPGDVHIERDGFHFYFPIVTCLIISAVVSLLLWLLRR